jgi:hypothetical protein
MCSTALAQTTKNHCRAHPDDSPALLPYSSSIQRRARRWPLPAREKAAGKWGATTYAVIMGQRFRWSRELRECSATLERAFADVERADLGPGSFDDFAFLIDLLVAQSAFGFLLQFEPNFDYRHVQLSVRHSRLIWCVLDPREAPRPVEPPPRKDARPLAIATNNQTIAVVFDFVNPILPTWRYGSYSGQTRLYKARWQHGGPTRGTPLHDVGMPEGTGFCNGWSDAGDKPV